MNYMPVPTTRAVIDVGRKCNINCSFCYYHHLGDLTKQTFKSSNELINDIDNAYNRENDYLDFTGGEPTIYPEICELVEYALKKYNMKSCIITNALIGENALNKLFNSGVDDFLLSIHGNENQHDQLTGLNGARKKQKRFVDQLTLNGKEFRINCVLSKYSQESFDEIINYILKINPCIVNFINMNPHGDWSRDIKGTKEVVADLRIVENLLNNGIEILESNGIGVNVRYYPMCRIAEKYRRCICNDLHVTFDPYEWDYDIYPKTYIKYRQWGVRTSFNIEHNGLPCNRCELFFICGGINGAFNAATNGNMPVKQQFDGDMTDFYYYRKDNVLTLKKRG